MKYECKCKEGDKQFNCEFFAHGKPSDSEPSRGPYICPWNHWRSAAWVKVEYTSKASTLLEKD